MSDRLMGGLTRLDIIFGNYKGLETGYESRCYWREWFSGRISK